MNCVECTVTACGDVWIAALEHRVVGPYRDRDLAVQVAIAEALRIKRAGGAARVVVKDGDTCAAHCICEKFFNRGNAAQA